MGLTSVIPAASPLRILIVEDSPDDRLLYRRLLDNDGRPFEIYEAGSLDLGLDISRKTELDCILLDYQLPDGDGLRFMRDLKEGSTAVVMVTGNGNADIAVQAMKMGALDYINKDSIAAGSLAQAVLDAVARMRNRADADRARGALERSYQALSDFAHTVSHDIKAPLRHIISYCDLLKEEYGRLLGEDGQRYADRLSANARRLQHLVDDLLAYSSVSRHEADRQDIDMQALVADILEDLDEAIRAEGAQISVGILPSVKGHPFRMRQLLQNLITNALKYHSARALTIDITGEDKGGYLQFCVRDNGRGIKEEYHGAIFEEFKRLHSKDAIEGTGLGLAICRKVAEMHGGKIWVESEPERGSRFCFTAAK